MCTCINQKTRLVLSTSAGNAMAVASVPAPKSPSSSTVNVQRFNAIHSEQSSFLQSDATSCRSIKHSSTAPCGVHGATEKTQPTASMTLSKVTDHV